MKLKLLALSLLLLTPLHSTEITEYYFDYPVDKIKSFTVYDEGELGERIVKLNFNTDGSLTTSKTSNFEQCFKNDELVSSSKDTKRMEFTKLFNILVPTRYVDTATKTDIKYTILTPSNSIQCEGILNGLPINIGNRIEGDMPTKLGSDEINRFYFNSLTEGEEMHFLSQIAKQGGME